jgi:PhnB protein
MGIYLLNFMIKEHRMDPRQPRMPWLSPYLAVRNLDRSTDFYLKAFGFKSKGMKDNHGNIGHINIFHKNTVLFMLHSEGSMGNPSRSPSTSNVMASQTFYVFVDNVDKMYEKAISNGARSVMAPEDVFWGDRMCTVLDVDGYSWSFAKALKKVTKAKKKKTSAKKKKVTKAKKTGVKKGTKSKKTAKKKAPRKAVKKRKPRAKKA